MEPEFIEAAREALVSILAIARLKLQRALPPTDPPAHLEP